MAFPFQTRAEGSPLLACALRLLCLFSAAVVAMTTYSDLLLKECSEERNLSCRTVVSKVLGVRVSKNDIQSLRTCSPDLPE